MKVCRIQPGQRTLDKFKNTTFFNLTDKNEIIQNQDNFYWKGSFFQWRWGNVVFDSLYSRVATCLHLYLAALLDCYIRGQEEWAEFRKKYDRSALFHFADTEQTSRETAQNL